jgi:protein TonB
MKVRGTGVQGWALAIGVHAVVLGAVLIGDPPPREAPSRRPPVRVRLVAPQRPAQPPPEPAEPPPAVKAQAPAPAPRTEVARPRRSAKPPPEARRVASAAPRPTEAPVQPAPPPRFSVSMSATVPAGGVAVPAAPKGSASPLAVPDWAGGRRDGKPESAPVADADAGPSRPLEVTEVSSSPRLLSQPSSSALRAAYPPRAREEGLEGNVVLRLLVGRNGRVAAVRVVVPAGNGFDEAARRLVRGFRFEAGKKDGQPVAVWIPWTYKFRLNG